MSSSESEHTNSGTGTITSEMGVSMLNCAFSRVSLPHHVTSMTHLLKPGVAALYISEILESWMMKRQTYGDVEVKKTWKEEEGPTFRLQHALDAFASALGLDLSHIHCASIVYGYRDHVLHCIQLIDTLFNVLDHEKEDRDAVEEQEKPRYDKHKEIDTTQNDSLLEDLDYLENFLARTKSHLVESPQRHTSQHHSPQRPRTAPTSTKHPLPTSAEVSYDVLDDVNTSLEEMAQRMGYEETHADQISNLARYVHQRKYHTPIKKSYRAEHGVSSRLYQSPTDEPEHWESRKHKLAYKIYKTTKALGSHVSTPSSSSYAAACARVDTLGASRRRADASVYQQLLRLIRSDDTVNAVQRKKMIGEIEAELGRRQARLAYWEEVALERARRLERCRKNQDDAAYRRFLSDELAVVISKLEAKRLATEKWYQDQYDMLREDVAAEKRWKEIQNKRDREAVRGYRRELKQATRDAIELAASRLSSASEAYRALIQPDEARLTYRPETSIHACSSSRC